MGQPFVGEIRMFGGNFAPAGWMFCDGQLLPISEYETLFNLIGTTYGGDGQSTFALPDLRGRLPVHQGTGTGSTVTIGQMSGSESVTLNVSQIPAHRHSVRAAASSATLTSPSGAVYAQPTAMDLYRVGSAPAVSTSSTGGTGGSQPHDNLMPSLCVSFIISLFGVYPSQN